MRGISPNSDSAPAQCGRYDGLVIDDFPSLAWQILSSSMLLKFTYPQASCSELLRSAGHLRTVMRYHWVRPWRCFRVWILDQKLGVHGEARNYLTEKTTKKALQMMRSYVLGDTELASRGAGHHQRYVTGHTRLIRRQ